MTQLFTTAEQTALRRMALLYETLRSSEQPHFDELFQSLQDQLEAGLPAGTVDAAMIAADAVEAAKIKDGAVTAAKLAAALLAKFAVVSWGTPGTQSPENAIEITLQLKDLAGENLAGQFVLAVSVSDSDLGDPSATAVITAAAVPVGEILAGDATATVTVRTNASGQVKLSVTDGVTASRFLYAWGCRGSGLIDCAATAELEFELPE